MVWATTQMNRSVMIEVPCECEKCGKCFDGAEWNTCPGCTIAEQQRRILMALRYLDDDAPVHAQAALLGQISTE